MSLLRAFELRLDGRIVRAPLSAQRVVAFLALNRGRHKRVFVAGHLWTRASEEHAAGALRTALWRLGPAGALLHCDGQSLALRPDVSIDVEETTRMARRVLDGAEPAILPAAAATLRDAGELLPDWYDDWVLVERERLRQVRLHALERLCVRFAADGRHAEATEAGIAAVAGDPLRESAHRALIAAHLAEGNTREALRQYDLCRRLLRRDLDIPPSALLEDLIGGLPRGDRPLVTAR